MYYLIILLPTVIALGLFALSIKNGVNKKFLVAAAILAVLGCLNSLGESFVSLFNNLIILFAFDYSFISFIAWIVKKVKK